MKAKNLLFLILAVLVIFSSIVIIQAANISIPIRAESWCSDSDGLEEGAGKNYFVQGTLTNGLGNTILSTRNDSCKASLLEEWYCAGPSADDYRSEFIDCSQLNPDLKCLGGACVYVSDSGFVVDG